jgi:hypothetical protein
VNIQVRELKMENRPVYEMDMFETALSVETFVKPVDYQDDIAALMAPLSTEREYRKWALKEIDMIGEFEMPDARVSGMAFETMGNKSYRRSAAGI